MRMLMAMIVLAGVASCSGPAPSPVQTEPENDSMVVYVAVTGIT